MLSELDPGSNSHLVQRDNTWFPQLPGTRLNLLEDLAHDTRMDH